MSKTANTQSIDLTNDDVRLLLQSLDHCLATCSKKDTGKPGPCADCDRAKELRGRLAKKIGV
jgi:hypothetical protein